MIVVDVETTGLDAKTASIVSIGAIDTFDPSNQFYEECAAFVGAEIDKGSLEWNGFTMEQVTNKSWKSVYEALFKFFDWSKGCEERTLAGHNIGHFDMPFLEETLKRYNMGSHPRDEVRWPFGYRSEDLHSVACSHIRARGMEVPLDVNGNSRMNMDKVLLYVGLPEEPKPHNALTGAKLEAEAFSRITFDKGLLPEYGCYPIVREYNLGFM